jgi:ankyrin repeat protein
LGQALDSLLYTHVKRYTEYRNNPISLTQLSWISAIKMAMEIKFSVPQNQSGANVALSISELVQHAKSADAIETAMNSLKKTVPEEMFVKIKAACALLDILAAYEENFEDAAKKFSIEEQFFPQIADAIAKRLSLRPLPINTPLQPVIAEALSQFPIDRNRVTTLATQIATRLQGNPNLSTDFILEAIQQTFATNRALFIRNDVHRSRWSIPKILDHAFLLHLGLHQKVPGIEELLRLTLKYNKVFGLTETEVRYLLSARGGVCNAPAFRTPLHLAVMRNLHSTVALLLDEKTLDFAAQDTMGLSVAHLVNDAHILDLLVSRGVKVDTLSTPDRYTSLHVVRNPETIIRLAKVFHQDVNQRDVHGDAPLHHAVAEGTAAAVDALLKCGADSNMPTADPTGPRAPHLLFFSGRNIIPTLTVFLQHNVNLDCADNNNNTLLHHLCYLILRQEINYIPNAHVNLRRRAAAVGHINDEDILRAMELLLQNGADPLRKNNRNQTPLDLLLSMYRLQPVNPRNVAPLQTDPLQKLSHNAGPIHPPCNSCHIMPHLHY